MASLDQTACMQYTLQRIDSGHPAEPYVVRFATTLTPDDSADCFLQEESKDRVFIRPVSMQVKHLEIITPRHAIIPGNDFTSGVVGKRKLTVGYAPVLRGRETF